MPNLIKLLSMQMQRFWQDADRSEPATPEPFAEPSAEPSAPEWERYGANTAVLSRMDRFHRMIFGWPTKQPPSQLDAPDKD